MITYTHTHPTSPPTLVVRAFAPKRPQRLHNFYNSATTTSARGTPLTISHACHFTHTHHACSTLPQLWHTFANTVTLLQALQLTCAYCCRFVFAGVAVPSAAESRHLCAASLTYICTCSQSVCLLVAPVSGFPSLHGKRCIRVCACNYALKAADKH